MLASQKFIQTQKTDGINATMGEVESTDQLQQ